MYVRVDVCVFLPSLSAQAVSDVTWVQYFSQWWACLDELLCVRSYWDKFFQASVRVETAKAELRAAEEAFAAGAEPVSVDHDALKQKTGAMGATRRTLVSQRVRRVAG